MAVTSSNNFDECSSEDILMSGVITANIILSWKIPSEKKLFISSTYESTIHTGLPVNGSLGTGSRMTFLTVTVLNKASSFVVYVGSKKVTIITPRMYDRMSQLQGCQI